MDDADWLLADRSAPAIVRGQGFPALVDITEAREQMTRFILDLFGAAVRVLRWASRGRATTHLSVGCFDDGTTWSLCRDGLRPRARRWGQGIITGEALTAILDHGFGAMGLNRVQALVMPRNELPLRLRSPSRLVREGVLRDHGVDETGAIRADQ